MQIFLQQHKAFFWLKKENRFYFRGKVFFNGKYYAVDNISEILDSIRDEETFRRVVMNFNGNFSLLVYCDNHWFVACDKIMSFPLFFCQYREEYYFSDDAKSLVELLNNDIKFNYAGLLDMATMGFTLANRTLFKGITVIGPGEYISLNIESQAIKKHVYYQHLHEGIVDFSENAYLQQLDIVVSKTFDRLVENLAGRQAVLFLSGGYDSRLIIKNLYERNYKNVVCISLRSENDLDVQVAKKIADHFSYTLIVVDYTASYWHNKAKQKDFWSFMDHMCNGIAVHYPQGMVVRDLLDAGKIERDSVILTGNSGDVVEGNDLSMSFCAGGVYQKKEIIEAIIETHCLNVINDIEIYKKIFYDIGEIIPHREQYNFSEAQDAYEYFNWRERQSFYVTSDARNYDDYSGNEWALPLWDDEFVQFWLSVPIQYRYKRKLYYQYVKNDQLPTANKATAWEKLRKLFLKYFNKLIYFVYPMRQILGYWGNRISFVYHGTISFYDWCHILWLTRGNKVNFMSALTYGLFFNVYGFDVFKKVKDEHRLER